MLPDVSEALTDWLSDYSLKSVARTTTNFVEAVVVTVRTLPAVVQVAQKDKLNTDAIDWSKRYLLVHSPDAIENGEYLEYGGEDYKIIDNGDWQAYGYTEAVAEQTKQTLLVETVVP